MELLDQVKQKISELHTCDAAYILAHAAWSACDHRFIPGPSVFEISTRLDSDNKDRVADLQRISLEGDFSNTDQRHMLMWLHERGFSKYIAKQVKTTKTKLVDWE